MKVKIKKLTDKAVIPSIQTIGDAGLDLTATTKTVQGTKITYGTGIAVEIPEGYVGLIFPRSSIHKKSQYLTNAVGVIDSGYRGEIMLKFKMDVFLMDFPPTNLYQVGDRVGQLVIIPYPQIEFEEVEELSDTERSDGGFGSTGA